MRILAMILASSMSMFVSNTSLACSVCGCDPSGGTLLVGISYAYGDFPTVVYANATARFNATNSRGNR